MYYRLNHTDDYNHFPLPLACIFVPMIASQRGGSTRCWQRSAVRPGHSYIVSHTVLSFHVLFLSAFIQTYHTTIRTPVDHRTNVGGRLAWVIDVAWTSRSRCRRMWPVYSSWTSQMLLYRRPWIAGPTYIAQSRIPTHTAPLTM